jgi:hypothetical protein
MILRDGWVIVLNFASIAAISISSLILPFGYIHPRFNSHARCFLAYSKMAFISSILGGGQFSKKVEGVGMKTRKTTFSRV